MLGVLGSLSLLLYRLGTQGKNSSERLATRLMLTGIALAFLPSIGLQAIPQLLGANSSGTLGFGVVQIAIPILPFFYIYAVYKRQLGPHEFRTNRLISLYSFILLYPTLFLVMVLSGNRWLTTASDRTVYLLVISTIFAVATPPLLARFRQWINKLAYGTEHDPDALIRVFADQVPSAIDRETLVELIISDILPSLLIW